MLVRDGWRRRAGRIEQLDHEIVHFRALADWLRSFSPEIVAERLRFVRAANAGRNAKVRLLVGGLDKLGVAPAAIAFALQVKDDFGGSTSLPYWLGVLGIVLAITSLVAFFASLMSLRLPLYAWVLAEVIATERSSEVATDRVASRGVDR